MCLGCVWDVFGMCLAWIWHGFGMIWHDFFGLFRGFLGLQGVQMCSKHNRILVPIFTNLFCNYFLKKIFCQKYFRKKYFFKNIFLCIFLQFFFGQMPNSYSLPKLTLTKNNTFRGFYRGGHKVPPPP